MRKLKTRADKGKSEEYIETRVNAYAKKLGIDQYKFTSPGHRSVPDRLYFPRGGRCFMIEFKREKGGKLTVGQSNKINRFTELGYPVYVCDSVQQGKDILDSVHALL